MKRRLTCLAVVAVVAAGSTAAWAAQIATGPHWIVQPTPNRAVPNNTLEGISCSSGSACIAVGVSGPLILASVTSRPFAAIAERDAAAGHNLKTLAERWDGTHWRIVPTPNPAGSTFTTLLGVTCTSRRACIAVGSAVAGKRTVPLAERWNGSRWSIERTPRPPRSSGSELVGVSCPASNDCLAVGDYGISVNSSGGFAERWNGSRWTLAGLVRPGTSAFLDSVSCSSATRCTAVGGYEVKTTTLLPLAERLAAGRWRKQSTPGTGSLSGVSCPAFAQCTAVGSRPNGQPNQSAVLAMEWNGGRWKAQSAPEPLGSTEAFLRGVSCPTVTSCEAAGWAQLTTTATVADHWNGTSWTLELTPTLTGTLAHQFTGVWCGAHIACRASGNVEMPSFDTQSLVERR